MTKMNPADKEELERQWAYELDRMFAMTFVDVSNRRFVFEVIATTAAVAGLFAAITYMAQLLHG